MDLNTTISPREIAIPTRPNRLRENRAGRIKQRVYEMLFGPVSELCYHSVLSYFPENAAVLDVGIGNGFMIGRFHVLIKSKRLKITGIDISEQALRRCARRINAFALEDYIELHLASIEGFRPQAVPRFDFVFFSMSFMLIKDQKGVLDQVRSMVSRGGEIVFFQTMFKKKLPVVNFIKPRLKYVKGIDFGPALHEDGFFSLLKDQRMTVKEDRRLQRKWFQGEYRMIVVSPEPPRPFVLLSGAVS
jgi:SAM-dependent methyltransferase